MTMLKYLFTAFFCSITLLLMGQTLPCNNPTFIKLYTEGKQQFQRGDCENAMRNIDRAFKICPRCPDCKQIITDCLNGGHQMIGEYSDGLALIRKDGKYGYVDIDGKIVIPAQFDKAWDFHEGLAVVQIQGLFGFIDMTGTIVISPRFESVGRFCEGMAVFEQNGQFGFINYKGQEVIPSTFDDVQRFDRGIALAIKNGRKFYINKKGQCVKNCP